uniref:Uncharacterized protein n=1 Tax=Panagrolaimus sp. ES5 TaxID=591445 RepID=A0AC34F2I6_9BILA
MSSVLKFIICIIFSLFFILINADDGGLSDIPFNGTPDQVQDAYRTKLAVELAEKGRIPLPSSRTLAKVGNAGIDAPLGGGAVGGANPVLATLGGNAAAVSNRLVGVRTGGTNTYSSVYNAGKR